MKDEAVKRLRITMLVCLATAATTAQAQLQDPTRPPPFLMSAGAAAGALSSVRAAPQLQSILIAPKAGGRHVVVIDGHTLRPGDTYKGAVLASVTGTQVVLQSGAKRQVLKLATDPAPR